MRKFIYILLIILSFSFVVGCNEEKTNEQEDSSIDLSQVVFEDVEVSYDGSEHSIFASNLPNGVTVIYEGNEVVEKGSYVVTAKIYDNSGNLLEELTATIHVVEKYDAELPLV